MRVGTNRLKQSINIWWLIIIRAIDYALLQIKIPFALFYIKTFITCKIW
jgi:hypothetical protein